MASVSCLCQPDPKEKQEVAPETLANNHEHLICVEDKLTGRSAGAPPQQTTSGETCGWIQPAAANARQLSTTGSLAKARKVSGAFVVADPRHQQPMACRDRRQTTCARCEDVPLQKHRLRQLALKFEFAVTLRPPHCAAVLFRTTVLSQHPCNSWKAVQVFARRQTTLSAAQ